MNINTINKLRKYYGLPELTEVQIKLHELNKENFILKQQFNDLLKVNKQLSDQLANEDTEFFKLEN